VDVWEDYETPVRCERGHLYTSIWVPAASVKAIRLGPEYRFQRCPVGRHWSRTHRVTSAELSPADRERAGQIHDSRLP
jgi:hypothetical protein